MNLLKHWCNGGHSSLTLFIDKLNPDKSAIQLKSKIKETAEDELIVMRWVILANQLAANGVTSQQQQEIVDAHNKLRRNTQPSAANMQKMVKNNIIPNKNIKIGRGNTYVYMYSCFELKALYTELQAV